MTPNKLPDLKWIFVWLCLLAALWLSIYYDYLFESIAIFAFFPLMLVAVWIVGKIKRKIEAMKQ